MIFKVNQKGFRTGSLFFIFLLTITFAFGQNEKLVSIIGVGDLMIGTNFPSKAYLPPDGGSGIFKYTADILQNADVTFGNLEGTLFDGEGEPKKCRDSTKCYLFRTPASYVRHYYDAGFDLLSIANNHSGDFGPPGRKGTKAVLKNAGILFAGLAGTDETTVYVKDGVRYGLAAFAPNTGTCDIRNLARAKAIVAGLEKTCDIVIVSFHGGAEGADRQHVTKATEEYLEENRGNVYEFSHAVIDAGADVVFGHGPHVTRAVELYKDRFIAYSLGNFATYSRMNLTGPSGLAPIVKIFTNEKGEFQKGEIIPTYQVKGKGPQVDPQRRIIQKIRELTAADFPNTPLEIAPDGKITKK